PRGGGSALPEPPYGGLPPGQGVPQAGHFIPRRAGALRARGLPRRVTLVLPPVLSVWPASGSPGAGRVRRPTPRCPPPWSRRTLVSASASPGPEPHGMPGGPLSPRPALSASPRSRSTSRPPSARGRATGAAWGALPHGFDGRRPSRPAAQSAADTFDKRAG